MQASMNVSKGKVAPDKRQSTRSSALLPFDHAGRDILCMEATECDWSFNSKKSIGGMQANNGATVAYNNYSIIFNKSGSPSTCC